MIAPKAGSEIRVDWQLDAVPCDGSRRLWSLWELMFVIDAGKLLAISNWISTLSSAMQVGAAISVNLHTIQSLRANVGHLKQEFSSLGMDAAEISADRLNGRLKSLEERAVNAPVRLQGDELLSMSRACTDFTTRAADQLKSRLLLAIENSDKELFVQTKPLFGQDVADNFPSVAYEIEEAGRCLALDRSTASAFHSLRCLEAGIRAISRCLAIPDPTKGVDRSWSKVLRDINTKMDSLWPKSGRLTGDGRFFEDVLAVLVAMQNPYRNSTMHLDQKYTGEEAHHIYEMVKGFMRKLASRCNENGDPKA